MSRIPPRRALNGLTAVSVAASLAYDLETCRSDERPWKIIRSMRSPVTSLVNLRRPSFPLARLTGRHGFASRAASFVMGSMSLVQASAALYQLLHARSRYEVRLAAWQEEQAVADGKQRPRRDPTPPGYHAIVAVLSGLSGWSYIASQRQMEQQVSPTAGARQVSTMNAIVSITALTQLTPIGRKLLPHPRPRLRRAVIGESMSLLFCGVYAISQFRLAFRSEAKQAMRDRERKETIERMLRESEESRRAAPNQERGPRPRQERLIRRIKRAMSVIRRAGHVTHVDQVVRWLGSR